MHDICAHGVLGTCTWSLDRRGVLIVNAAEGAPASPWPPWNSYSSNVTEIRIEDGVVLSSDCMSLFKGLSSLTSINLAKADMSRVSIMREMFEGCHSLTSLDVSGRDVSSVSETLC